MGNEPTYICSGADRPGKVPELPIEAILFNAPALLQGKASAKNANTIIKQNKIEQILLDSGGKQIFEVNTHKNKKRSRDVNKKERKKWRQYVPDGTMPLSVANTLHLAPEHLAEAALKIDNVTIVMALDDPVMPSNNPEEQRKNFYSKLQRNVDFARRAVEIRNEKFPHIKIFAPLQFQALQDFEVLWQLIKSFEIDGISLPARCFKKASNLTPLLKRIIEIGITNVHFLGSSRLQIVALLSFLAKKNYFSHLGFDSSSWLMSAINGEIIMPYSLICKRIVDEGFADTTAKMVEIDSIYQKYNLFDFKMMSKSEQTQALITLNFWAICQTKHELFNNADSPESLCAFLETQGVNQGETLKIFGLLNDL